MTKAADMNPADMTAAQRLIVSFMGADAKVEFYTSAVDGTMCVEWLSFGRYERATVVALGKRIMRYKKERNRIAA